MFISRFNKSVLAIAVSSMFSSTVFADELKDDDIERISVWSTQVKTSSLYLKGEEIADKQADHISDLLRSIPGVDVGGAHSLNQRITIRSMDDKDLNITIDGAAQNSYMYHHMGNLQIHADILKSVDIEIGSNSIVNGGLGGAVRFETKQARDLLAQDQRFGGRVQVSAGDNSGSNYSLTGYGLIGDSFDFLGYYNAVERDNYEVGGGKIKDHLGEVVENTDGKVRGLSGDLDDALIKFGWNISNNQRVSLGYETYKDQGDYTYRPDMGLATDIAATQALKLPLLWPTEFTRDTLTFNYDVTWGESTLKATAYTNTSELWRDQTGWAQNERFANRAAIVTGEAKNSGLNVLAETAIESDNISHELTYGFNYLVHETHYESKTTSAVDTSEEESSTVSLFIQNRVTFENGITLIPGVRYDNYDIDSSVVDDSYDQVSFSLAAELSISDNTLLKVSSTEIFKGPEISEVFVGAGQGETENPHIKAETGLNTEIAIAYQDAVLGADAFSMGATLFRTVIDDYIYDYASIPNDPNPRASWKDNIGDMEIDGYEAYVGYQLGNFNGQITFSSAESDLDAFSQYKLAHDGARLDRQQGDTISVNFSYAIDALNLDVNWETMQVSDVTKGIDLGGATENNAKQGFVVHNISAHWEPDSLKGVTVIVGVDNVFDEYYASQSSHTGLSKHFLFGDLYLFDYEPGRNIKATVSYQF